MATFQRLREQPRNTLATAVLISIATFGFTSGHIPVVSAAKADHMVALYVDGSKRVFSTEAETVADALGRTGTKLGSKDLVEPVGATRITGDLFRINVHRARPVLVQDGYKTLHLTSAHQSPRLLAEAAGLKIYPEDKFKTELITDIVNYGAIGVRVDVDRATPLRVKVDGKVLGVRTQGDTVKQALSDAGIALGLQDTVSQPLNSEITPNMTVAVSRVAEAETTVTSVIPRPVKVTTDPTLAKGKVRVDTEGADGQKVALFRIHYRDGVETSRELLKLVSQTEPVTRVEIVGTKVFFSGSVEYWRPMVEAAAAEYNLDPNMMLRIMSCESKGNATAVSKFAVGTEHPTGLYQYLPSTWVRAGGTEDNILDGATQIKLTARKMARDGTSEWSCR